MTNTLLLAGGLIIAVLAGVALWLHWKLYLMGKKRNRLLQEQARELAVKRERSLNSILVLARGMLEDQVTLTEASIRISVLMEGLQLPESERSHYMVFYKLAEATAHIPILDKWKALSREEKKSFDREREKHEDRFRDFLMPAAQRLVQQESFFRQHLGQFNQA